MSAQSYITDFHLAVIQCKTLFLDLFRQAKSHICSNATTNYIYTLLSFIKLNIIKNSAIPGLTKLILII